MKAFAFRLEQVLRWRDMQVGLQKARAAAAAGQVSRLKTNLESLRAEVATGAAQIVREPTGFALAGYAAFVQKSRFRIRELEEQIIGAERILAAEMDRLLEANRRLRLLEDLKRKGQGHWQHELERELAAFADEAFAAGYNRGNGRARSSGG